MENGTSKIVTFYSYKGGVGRSMAVANVSWLLAKRYGYKVLAIDWDLEAPGLHRFFEIEEKEIDNGLIDLFYDYKELLKEENFKIEDGFLNINKYVKHLKTDFSQGSISFIPAGKFDRSYSARVNNLDWNNLYDNWHGFGFIEYFKKQLKKEFDFILVDSRTGISDTGGICTLQVPDAVVILFSLNEQNISGTEMIIESILKKSPEFKGETTPPKLIIVPSRIEKFLEIKTKDEWEIKAAERFKKYLPKNEDSTMYMKKKAIPYVGYYSYGEKIAVKENPNDDLAESFDKLTIMTLQKLNREVPQEYLKILKSEVQKKTKFPMELQQAIKASKIFKNSSFRTSFLSTMIPNISNISFKEVIDIAGTLPSDPEKDEFLNKCYQNGPELEIKTIQELLVASKIFKNSSFRTSFLNKMTPNISKIDIDGVIAIAETLPSDPEKNGYLVNMLSKLNK